MDPTYEIKARLPIEELVGSYCQLQKKGRQFVCLCPFHNDTRPSLQVSPDKGIAYCFACQTGGDIFSFYQAIEGVDFRQALLDLAERTGVTIEDTPREPAVKKDEKERARECLEAARLFYQKTLEKSEKAVEYLKNRKVTGEQVVQFGIGVAPDSFSDTYQHLLKEGFSRKEILTAGLGVQKELKDEKIYDRFRNRIMFPIHDHQGKIIGFGGRTLGEEDAKYINSADGPLYHKSEVLYGLNYAKKGIRSTKKVIMVEGYFDVVACHRVGVSNVVAVSGTALTEQHVKKLRRYADTVILCLDQDRAGQEAAERAFLLCAAEELPVHAVTLADKDPADAAMENPEELKKTLEGGGVPYIDLVLSQIAETDVTSTTGKRTALQRLLPLLKALKSSVELEHYIGAAAKALGTTDAALRDDIARIPDTPAPQVVPSEPDAENEADPKAPFSSLEVALGLIMLYPQHRDMLSELIEPEKGMSEVLYTALKELPEAKTITIDMLEIPEEYKERVSILLLFCEHHGFADWSENMALREIRSNCQNANREVIRRKQQEITAKMAQARKDGKKAEETQLAQKYEQLLKLSRMAK